MHALKAKSLKVKACYKKVSQAIHLIFLIDLIANEIASFPSTMFNRRASTRTR